MNKAIDFSDEPQNDNLDLFYGHSDSSIWMDLINWDDYNQAEPNLPEPHPQPPTLESNDTKFGVVRTGASDQVDTGRHLPDAKSKTKAVRFTSEQNQMLTDWLFSHSDSPYPTPGEKKELATLTGLMESQIGNWMANNRRRKLITQKDFNLALNSNKSLYPQMENPSDPLVYDEFNPDTLNSKNSNSAECSLEVEPGSSRGYNSDNDTRSAEVSFGDTLDLPTIQDMGPLRFDDDFDGSFRDWWLENQGFLDSEDKQVSPHWDRVKSAKTDFPPLPIMPESPNCLELSVSEGEDFIYREPLDWPIPPTKTCQPGTGGPSSYSSFMDKSSPQYNQYVAGSAYVSSASASSVSSFNSIGSLSRRQGRRLFGSSQRQDQPASNVYKCRYPHCETKFSRTSTRNRHERDVHRLSRTWVCEPILPEILDGTKIAECPFCRSAVQSAFCSCTRKIKECWTRPADRRTFQRKDGLEQHFRTFHKYTGEIHERVDLLERKNGTLKHVLELEDAAQYHLHSLATATLSPPFTDVLLLLSENELNNFYSLGPEDGTLREITVVKSQNMSGQMDDHVSHYTVNNPGRITSFANSMIFTLSELRRLGPSLDFCTFVHDYEPFLDYLKSRSPDESLFSFCDYSSIVRTIELELNELKWSCTDDMFDSDFLREAEH